MAPANASETVWFHCVTDAPFTFPLRVLLSYAVFKFVHVLGVVLLIGNVTVTAVWKVFADRNGQPVVIAFAQRMVTITDWFLTVVGVLLIIVGGYGMAAVGAIPVFGARWLSMSQLLFVVAGVIWLGILVPIQAAQTRAVRAFTPDMDTVPESYRALSRRWIFWGVVATCPLVMAMYLMTAKI